MAGAMAGVLANLLQPKLVQQEAKMFSDRTAVLSDLFPDGQIVEGESMVSVSGSGVSEVRWLSQLGRSVAGGARFNTERLPSERRTLTATREVRSEIAFDWFAEPFAHYFADIEVDLTVEGAGPLGRAVRAQAVRASQIQKRAAEAIVRKMMSWHFHGPVTNALATVHVAAAAAATALVARRNVAVAQEGERGAYCLGAGVPFVVVDAATGTPRGVQGYRVTSVVVGGAAAGHDTVNFEPGLDVALVAGDLIVEGDALSQSFGRGVVSIQAMAGDAVDSEMLHGRSRLQYPQLSSTVVRDPALAAFRRAAIAVVEQTLFNSQARSDWDDVEEVVAIMPPGLAAEFLFAGFRAATGAAINAGEQPAQDLVRYSATRTKVMYGFTGFDFLTPSAPGGKITILADADARPNAIRIIVRKDYKKWPLQSPTWGEGTVLDGTGHRIQNFYRGFATFWAACALTCHNSARQIAINQIGHQNILVAQGGSGSAATLL